MIKIEGLTDDESAWLDHIGKSTLFTTHATKYALTGTGRSLIELLRAAPKVSDEAQAVLDMAVDWNVSISSVRCINELRKAVELYKATLTPPLDLEKLKWEMDEAGQRHLDNVAQSYDVGLMQDYIDARKAYETALRQAEERGKAQEKAASNEKLLAEFKDYIRSWKVSEITGAHYSPKWMKVVALYDELEGKS